MAAKAIEGDSEAYQSWQERGATHIVAIANLPFADKDAKTLDPRKYILKIEDGFLSSQSDIYIKIGATGLSKTTKYAAAADLPNATTTEEQPVQLKLKCTSKHGQDFMECEDLKTDQTETK